MKSGFKIAVIQRAWMERKMVSHAARGEVSTFVSSFNRVGNAPRFIFQISNIKYEISNQTSAARWARG